MEAWGYEEVQSKTEREKYASFRPVSTGCAICMNLLTQLWVFDKLQILNLPSRRHHKLFSSLFPS